MERKEAEVVCVTGASGFIGSELVRQLLLRGYVVHATVQDLSYSLLLLLPKNEQETKHLEALEGAKTRLRLFQMDLLDYTSIFASINGVSGVFHVASPCVLQVHDPQKQLLEPAIEGTKNVLKAAKELGVRRVVLTSSFSTIIPNYNWPADVVLNGDSWSDVDYCRRKGVDIRGKALVSPIERYAVVPDDNVSQKDKFCRGEDLILELWYSVSKNLAEKAAWEFAKEKDLNMVVVIPGAVFDPILPPTINSSMSVLLRLLQGCTDTLQDFYGGAVHVKDVALAHILVYESTSATGRHLCAESISHFGDFAAKVAEIYPEYKLPRLPKDTQPGMLRDKNPSKKLMDLGLQFIPIEQIIKDSVESLKSKGSLTKIESLMDSRRRRLSFLLLFFITAAILFPNLSSASSRESVKNSEKSKVTLAIYYESLCPYCSNFIVNDLVELFESGLISDVDLKLIPYGNARIGPNDTLTCQR
ncbi:unnamed protein product [Camellia sinensis]